MRGVEVVHDDQVEVGGGGHLAAAELAHGEQRHLLAAQPAVAGGELLLDAAMHGADGDVGKPRKGFAGLRRGDGAGQNARADQERLVVAEHAHGVEIILIAARFGERPVELRGQLGLVGQGAEEGGIEQGVDRLRVARQDVGETRRNGERADHQRDEIRVLPEQRKQPAAAAQAGEELIEGGKRGVGVFLPRQAAEQNRQELAELLARERTFERAVGAGQPAAYHGGGLQRLAKTVRAQPVEGGAIVCMLGKAQRLCVALGRLSEQLRIVMLHLAQMTEQRLGKIVAVREAGETGELVERDGIGRQRVGLLVGDHLQAVLDGAQEPVGLAELVAGGGADPAGGGQRVEGGERLAQAQLRIAAAGDELLGLHEKLDLADAAAADLDVVTFDRDLVVAAVGVNLLLHRLDVGDRGVVEIFAPDEGRDFAQKRLARGDVAGAGARLDHCRALPVLADAAVIIGGGGERHRDLGGGRIGAQPQIDAEHIAVGGALLHQLHEAAGEPNVERRGVVLVHERGGFGVEQDNEIDVAGIIELVGPHLAHGQHHKAAARLGCRRIGRLELAAAHGVAQQEAHGGGNRAVGKRGERLGGAHHRPHAADVGKRDQQRGFRLQAAQQAHDFGLVVRGGDGALGLLDQGVKVRGGIGLQQRKQARRLFGGEAPKVRRRFGQRGEERSRFRRCIEQPSERLAGGVARNAGKPSGKARPRGLGRSQARRGGDGRSEILRNGARGFRRGPLCRLPHERGLSCAGDGKQLAAGLAVRPLLLRTLTPVRGRTAVIARRAGWAGRCAAAPARP